MLKNIIIHCVDISNWCSAKKKMTIWKDPILLVSSLVYLKHWNWPVETWFHHHDSHQKVCEDGEGHHGEAQENGSVFSYAGLGDLSSGFLVALHLPRVLPLASIFLNDVSKNKQTNITLRYITSYAVLCPWNTKGEILKSHQKFMET